MAKFLREKAVLVSVYVERPRRRRALANSHHHDHHHHVHHSIKQEANFPKKGDAGKGYNRRSELLRYSQHLRESARSEKISLLEPKPLSIIQKPEENISVANGLKKHSAGPFCFGNGRVPRFCGSLTSLLNEEERKNKTKKKKKQKGSVNNTMKAIKKSLEYFQIQKEGGFLWKRLNPTKA